MNNEKVLPRRALTPQKPSYIRLFRASEITPTRQMEVRSKQSRLGDVISFGFI